MTDTVWNDQKVDELKGYWKSGLSSREIAAEMHVTRNTVIGKVARLKLEPRAPRMNEAQKQKRKLAAKVRHTDNQRNRRAKLRGESKPPLPPLPRPVIAPPPSSREIPFRDLRDFRRSDTNECRFITGDGDPFLVCGNPTDVGESYCSHCKTVTHNKALPISDEERERRRRHATRNWAAANAKMYGPAEASTS